MNIKYVYRIDDIHPAMIWKHFFKVMTMMEAHRVVPLLGVIPDNQDQSLMFDPPDPEYDSIIKLLVGNHKAEICQHGYRHVYLTRQKSINQFLYGRVGSSEFAGLSYQNQLQMISEGKKILESIGLFTKTWMAPSHTSDHNTYKALKNLGFKYVTDGIALFPYQKYGLTFVPQQIFRPCKDFPFDRGIFTICLHLNNLTEDRIYEIETHLESGAEIIPFSEAARFSCNLIHKGWNTFYKIKRASSCRIVRPYRNLREQIGFSYLNEAKKHMQAGRAK